MANNWELTCRWWEREAWRPFAREREVTSEVKPASAKGKGGKQASSKGRGWLIEKAWWIAETALQDASLCAVKGLTIPPLLFTRVLPPGTLKGLPTSLGINPANVRRHITSDEMRSKHGTRLRGQALFTQHSAPTLRDYVRALKLDRQTGIHALYSDDVRLATWTARYLDCCVDYTNFSSSGIIIDLNESLPIHHYMAYIQYLDNLDEGPNGLGLAINRPTPLRGTENLEDHFKLLDGKTIDKVFHVLKGYELHHYYYSEAQVAEMSRYCSPAALAWTNPFEGHDCVKRAVLAVAGRLHEILEFIFS